VGTRADFYLGRGDDAVWLGSRFSDSHPENIPVAILAADTPQAFEFQVRSHIARVGRPADRGWHWPWRHSGDTGYTYAFDGHRTLIGVLGRWHTWQDGRMSPALPEPFAMPDMVARLERAGPAAVLRWKCAVSSIVLDESKDIRLAIWGFLVVRLWLLAWHVVRIPATGGFGTLRSGFIESVGEQYLVQQLLAKLALPEGQAVLAEETGGDATMEYCVGFIRRAMHFQWHRTLAGTGQSIRVDTGIPERRSDACSPEGTVHLEVRLLEDGAAVEGLLRELAAVAEAAPPCAARPFLRLADANGWECPDAPTVEMMVRTREGRELLREQTDPVFRRLLYPF
jgi:hypothetical protein